MGKKPVLGLLGACLMMTLTGCRGDNGWGWGSRKEGGPATARIDRSGGGKRTRSIGDSQVVKGSDPSRLKGQYDFPADSHAVPEHLDKKAVASDKKPVMEKVVEKKTEDVVETVEKVEKVEKTVVHESIPVVTPVSDKKSVKTSGGTIDIPPEQPMTIGEMPEKKETAPAKVEKKEPELDLSPVPSAPEPEKPAKENKKGSESKKEPTPVEPELPEAPMIEGPPAIEPPASELPLGPPPPPMPPAPSGKK